MIAPTNATVLAEMTEQTQDLQITGYRIAPLGTGAAANAQKPDAYGLTRGQVRRNWLRFVKRRISFASLLPDICPAGECLLCSLDRIAPDLPRPVARISNSRAGIIPKRARILLQKGLAFVPNRSVTDSRKGLLPGYFIPLSGGLKAVRHAVSLTSRGDSGEFESFERRARAKSQNCSLQSN